MKKILQKIKNDQPLKVGLVLVTLSALLYAFTFSMYNNFDEMLTPLFSIHYTMAIIYFFYLAFKKALRLTRLFCGESRIYHLLLMMLFNISAYSLNHSFPVFHESVDWVSIFLVVENALLIVYILAPSTNRAFLGVLLFMFTFALIFNIYQAIVIFPYMVLGVLAFLFLGISLHVLVPAAFVLAIIMIMKDLLAKGAKWYLIPAATLAFCVIIGTYIWQWNQINNIINESLYSQYLPGYNQDLPEWIKIAQVLPNNALSEKALQAGLVYQNFNNYSLFDSGVRRQRKSLHDPLVAIAGMATGNIDLDNSTRIKILDALHNMRHDNAERFWSGLNLKTSNVITNIELFPSYRLAYTEMILRIKNEKQNNYSSWFSQEEAIYTFQLPEGGTVTSLSLWIEGHEAKARLTTKAKAERAYNTIVGREVRDPSAVYWMEGNKIRVRVFPCTPDEERQFKLGITAPLTLKGNRLHYNSISFKGPGAEAAKASINIQANDNVTPRGRIRFKNNGSMHSWTGSYVPEWNISFPDAPIGQSSFSFNGFSYTASELPSTFESFMPTEIYLDIHNGWKVDDLKEIAKIFPERAFKIYNYKSGRMDDYNIYGAIQLLQNGDALNFTLFPFHKIKNPEKALVITNGNKPTPNLADFKEAEFKKKLFSYFDHSSAIKIFDLNSQPCDFIRSLNEFKVLQYASGNAQTLATYAKTEKFPTSKADKDTVVIGPAKIQITKTAATEDSADAPDHLLRLFAYNQVLKSIGCNYFNKEYLDEEIIKEAALGNVVTPVSSLIVLETLNDYKRFDIEENKGSLGNAALNSSGAVPEPHEWALIIIGLIFLGWIWFFKNKKAISL